MRKGLNSVCFVQVNHLLLSKSYEKTSGELTFGRGESNFSWGESNFSWGETTLSWGERTLSWGETDLGRNGLGRTDRKS